MVTSWRDLLNKCIRKENINVIDDVELEKTLSRVCPVQRPWLYNLPWKMQTVINQGLRAPDSRFSPKVKIVARWLRSICICNADSNHTFMCRKDSIPGWAELDNEINYLTLHYVTHFIYAIEIVAYKHPNEEVQAIAMELYEGLVKYQMHFEIESEDAMDTRLADVDDKVMPDIFAEAPRPPKCPINDSYIER
jgi:hypothetical protein